MNNYWSFLVLYLHLIQYCILYSAYIFKYLGSLVNNILYPISCAWRLLLRISSIYIIFMYIIITFVIFSLLFNIYIVPFNVSVIYLVNIIFNVLFNHFVNSFIFIQFYSFFPKLGEHFTTNPTYLSFF